MNVLLINPPIENMIKNVPSFIAKVRDEGYPNLGILYIAAYLKQNSDATVKILDAQIERLNHNQLKKKVENIAPDVVGINATSFTLIDAILTARDVKSVDKNIMVVFGGRHPSIYPEETIGFPDVDFVVIGEGEITFTELVKSIGNGTAVKNIKGLVFRNRDKTIFTGSREPIRNLDELPFPARYLTPYKKYKHIMTKNKVFTTMMTSRGCPYNCLFCDRSQGNIFRARSPKNIVDEMEECLNMGIKNIFVHDDTFTLDRERAISICDEILKRKLNVHLIIRTRADLVDNGLLGKLRSAGCEKVHYGIESGNERILKILKKGITKEQVENAVKNTKENNMEVLGDFMIGSPGEKEKEILETIDFAIRLDLDYAFFSITTPYPATQLYKAGLEKGIYHDYWKGFSKNPTTDFKPKLWTEDLFEEDVYALYKYAYKHFYKRPAYIFKQLPKITSLQELIGKIKIGLQLFNDAN